MPGTCSEQATQQSPVEMKYRSQWFSPGVPQYSWRGPQVTITEFQGPGEEGESAARMREELATAGTGRIWAIFLGSVREN